MITFSKNTEAYFKALDNPTPEPIRPLNYKERVVYDSGYKIPYQKPDRSFVYYDPFDSPNAYSHRGATFTGTETLRTNTSGTPRVSASAVASGYTKLADGTPINSNPDVATAQKGADTTWAGLKALGSDLAKPTWNAVQSVFSVLQSGLYAMAEHHQKNLERDYMTADSAGGTSITTGEHIKSFVRDFTDPALAFNPFGLIATGATGAGLNLYKDYAKGFSTGMQGEEGTTFSKIVHDTQFKDWSSRHQAASAAVGFGLDIAFDPLTYVGIGVAPGFIVKGGKAASLAAVGKKGAAMRTLNTSIWTKTGREEGYRVLKSDIVSKQMRKLDRQERRLDNRLAGKKFRRNIGETAYETKVARIADKRMNTTVGALRGRYFAWEAFKKHKLSLGLLAVSRVSEGAHKAGMRAKAVSDLNKLKQTYNEATISQMHSDPSTKSLYYLLNDGTNTFEYKAPNGKTHRVKWDGSYDDFVEKVADHISPVTAYNSDRTRLSRGRKAEIHSNKARVDAFFNQLGKVVRDRTTTTLYRMGDMNGFSSSHFAYVLEHGDSSDIRSVFSGTDKYSRAHETPIHSPYKVPGPDSPHAGSMTMDEFKALTVEELEAFNKGDRVHLTDSNTLVDPHTLLQVMSAHGDHIVSSLSGKPRINPSSVSLIDRMNGLNEDIVAARDEILAQAKAYDAIKAQRDAAQAALSPATPDTTTTTLDLRAALGKDRTNTIAIAEGLSADGPNEEDLIKVLQGTVNAFTSNPDILPVLKNTNTSVLPDGTLMSKDFTSAQKAGEDLDIKSQNSLLAVAVGEIIHEAMHAVAKYNAALEQMWEPKNLAVAFSSAAGNIFNKLSVDVQEMALGYLYSTHGMVFPTGVASDLNMNKTIEALGVKLSPTGAALDVPDTVSPIKHIFDTGNENNPVPLYRTRNTTDAETALRGEAYKEETRIDLVKRVGKSTHRWLDDIFGEKFSSTKSIKSVKLSASEQAGGDELYKYLKGKLDSLKDVDGVQAAPEGTVGALGYSPLDLVLHGSEIKDANKIRLNGMFKSSVGRLAAFMTSTPPDKMLEAGKEVGRFLKPTANNLVGQKPAAKFKKYSENQLKYAQSRIRNDLYTQYKDHIDEMIDAPTEHFSKSLGGWARIAVKPGGVKDANKHEIGLTPALAHSMLESAFGGPLAGKTLDNAIREFLTYKTLKNESSKEAGEELTSLMQKYFDNPDRKDIHSNTIRNIIHRNNTNPKDSLSRYEAQIQKRSGLNTSVDEGGSPSNKLKGMRDIGIPSDRTSLETQEDLTGFKTVMDKLNNEHTMVRLQDAAQENIPMDENGGATQYIKIQDKDGNITDSIKVEYDPKAPTELKVTINDSTSITVTADGKLVNKKTRAGYSVQAFAKGFNSTTQPDALKNIILKNIKQHLNDQEAKFTANPNKDLTGTGAPPKYYPVKNTKTVKGNSAESIDPKLEADYQNAVDMRKQGAEYYNDLIKQRRQVQKEIEDLAKTPDGEKQITDFVNHIRSEYDPSELQAEILKAHDNIMSNLWALQNRVFKSLSDEKIVQQAHLGVGIAPTVPVPHMTNYAHYLAGVTALRQEQGRVSDLMARFMSVDPEENLMGSGGARFMRNVRRPSSILDQRIMEIRRAVYNSYEPITKVLKQVINQSWPLEARRGEAVKGFLSMAHLQGASVFPTGLEDGFNQVVARLSDLSEDVAQMSGRYGTEGEELLDAVSTQTAVPYGMRLINSYLPENFRLNDEQLKAVHNAVLEHMAANPDVMIAPYSHEWHVIMANTLTSKHELSIKNKNINFAHYEFALQDARLKMRAGDDFKTSFYNTFGAQLNPSLVALQNNTTGLEGINSKLASVDDLIRTGRLQASDVPAVFRRSGWYVPEDFVKDMKFAFDYIHNRDVAVNTKLVTGLLRHLGNLWKKMVTIYDIKYHSSSQLSDMWMSFMDGVRDPSVYTDGFATVWNARGMLNKIHEDPEAWARLQEAMGERFIYDDMAKSTDTLDAHATATPSTFQKEDGTGSEFDVSHNSRRLSVVLADGNTIHLDDFQLYKLFHETGLSQNSIRASIIAGVAGGRRNILVRGAGFLDDKIVDFSDFREEASRMAHFIHAIRDEAPIGGNLTDVTRRAADRVMKYRFDYSDVTILEQRYVQNWVPFYKWMKNIIPFTIQMIINKPRYFTMEGKINTALAEAYGDDPEEVLKEDLVYIPQTDGNGMIPWTTYMSTEDNRVMPDYATINLPLVATMGQKMAPTINPMLDYAQGYGDAKSMGYGVISGMTRTVVAGFSPLPSAVINASTGMEVWASAPMDRPNTYVEKFITNTIPGGIAYKSFNDNMKGDPILRLTEMLGVIRHTAVNTKTEVGAFKQAQDKMQVELDKLIAEKQAAGELPEDKEEARKIIRKQVEQMRREANA